jgi:hypothetical protein
VQTCRCHGAALGVPLPSSAPSLSCPVSGQHLDERDYATNNVKIGTDTVLHVPSSNASDTTETSAEKTDAMEIEVVGLRNLKSLGEGKYVALSSEFIPSPSSSSKEACDMEDGSCSFLQGVWGRDHGPVHSSAARNRCACCGTSAIERMPLP